MQRLMNWAAPNSDVEDDTTKQIYFLQNLADSVQGRLDLARHYSFEPRQHLLTLFERHLRDVNPYARSFHMLNEVLRAAPPETRYQEVMMAINPLPANHHWRRAEVPLVHRYFPDRHEVPQVNDVAAVFVGEAPQISYDVRVLMRRTPDGEYLPQHNSDAILANCKSVDHLCYPLFHLEGESGWWTSTSTMQGLSKKPTLNQYYSYVLQIRAGKFNPIILGQKLFSQYVIDASLKITDDNLRYVREKRQANLLRSENAAVLREFLASEAARLNKNVGRLVILPADFRHGAKFMNKQFQDSMAMMTKFGHPSFFVTFTMNTQWPEMTEALKAGNLSSYEQASQYRPDLIMRVFWLRFRVFFADIIHHQALGVVIAYSYVVEFQRLSLPHVHFALIMARAFRVTSPEMVDRIISAELPDPEKDPELFAMVKKWNIHAFCDRDTSKGCLRDVPGQPGVRRCRFRFPKDFQEYTEIGGKGEIKYRRRDNGRGFVNAARDRMINNQWVVPYNPVLTMRHDTHINIQVCNGPESFKYMFGYMTKGQSTVGVDVMTFSRNQASDKDTIHCDEIDHYMEMSSLMAPDAMGRILQIPYYGKSVKVLTLPVHLPGQQLVFFQEGGEEEAADASDRTMLTAFFEVCAASRRPTGMLYSDVVSAYRWETRTHEWIRKRNVTGAIGRLAAANPNTASDRFYLRLLLLNRRDPKSFVDLRTVNGVEYETFEEACIAMGLLEDDIAYHMCLREMINVQRPFQLRQLFARILMYCGVTRPVELWDTFKRYLSADYQYVLSLDDRAATVSAESLALAKIAQHLQAEGRRLADYSLALDGNVEELVHVADGLCDLRFSDGVLEDVPDDPADVDALVDSLNLEQRQLLDDVLTELSFETPTANLFYVDGPGGSGKTYLYNVLARKVVLMGKKVVACAYTGLAASLLVGGRTSHNVFGIPVKELDESSTSSHSLQSEAGGRLADCDVILWDEISMTSKWQLNVAHELLQQLMSTNAPMGGKIVIFGGDFRQTLPIPPRRGQRPQVVSNTVLHHDLWRQVRKYTLSINMRAASATEEFRQWLLDIGRGMPTTLSTGLISVTP